MIVGGAFWVAASSLTAQDALRSAVQGDRSYEARNATDFRPTDDGLRIGPVNFSVAASYKLEWNDNIRLTPANRDSDFIHSPQVDLKAIWPATKESTLSVGMGIGYRKYMDSDNRDLSRLSITPDSEVAWDIRIDDFLITLHDLVSYSQDVANEGGLSGKAEFPHLENTVGMRVQWRPDPWMTELGYNHFNFFADSVGFDYLSRSSEQFHGRAAYQIATITSVGLEASGSLTDYDDPQQSDNQSISVGPFVDWQILQELRVTARGGYVLYFFDPSPVTTTNNMDELSAYYFGLDVNHKLTDYITHTLSVDRSVRQGVNQGSQITERLKIEYAVTWAFHESATLSANTFFEHGREPQFGITEEFDRVGAGGSITCRPTDRVTLGLRYRYITKDSNSVITNNDYDQNVISFTASYRF